MNSVLTNEGSLRLFQAVSGEGICVPFGAGCFEINVPDTALNGIKAKGIAIVDGKYNVKMELDDGEYEIEAARWLNAVSVLPLQTSDDRTAIDYDFSAQEDDTAMTSYNLVIAFAQIYREYLYLQENTKYHYGDGVFVKDYPDKVYVCIVDEYEYTPASPPPYVDADHWVELDKSTLIPYSGNKPNYYCDLTYGIAALYAIKYDESITLADDMYLHYKMRLFLGKDPGAQVMRISEQLENWVDPAAQFLAEIAMDMRDMRDMISTAVLP